MAVLSGAFEIRRIWIWVAWFAAIIWVCSNLYIYLHRADRSRIQPVLRFDAWWRAILLVVAAGAAIAALLGAGITGTWPRLLAIAFASALAEAVSPHGWDNATMQLVPAALFAWWLT